MTLKLIISFCSHQHVQGWLRPAADSEPADETEGFPPTPNPVTQSQSDIWTATGQIISGFFSSFEQFFMLCCETIIPLNHPPGVLATLGIWTGKYNQENVHILLLLVHPCVNTFSLLYLVEVEHFNYSLFSITMLSWLCWRYHLVYHWLHRKLGLLLQTSLF